MPRTRHFGLAVSIDMLMRGSFPEDFEGILACDGRDLDPEEAVNFLALEKAKGRTFLPASERCGSPCPHAAQGCSGFNYNKGCPGHDAI